MSPDGTRVFSGSDGATVKVWDTSTGELVQTLNGHTSYVTSVAVSLVLCPAWDRGVS